MSHPLDDLYSRLLDNWQRDPSTLDNPLLARAFEAAEPNRSLQDQLDQALLGLEAERGRLGAQVTLYKEVAARYERRIADLKGEIAYLKRTGSAKLKAAQKRIKELEPRVLQPVKTQEGEAEQLANLGWRKGT